VPLSQLIDRERELLADGATVRRYDPTTGRIVPLALDADRVWFVAPDLAEGAKEVRQGPGYVVFQMASGQMPARDVDVRFGSFVRMLDHHIEKRSPERGPVLTLTIHWAVEQPPHRAAVSFAHLLDVDGRYIEGWDGLTSPATCWQVGDLIEQQYRIPLPEGLSPGSYPIEIGWYDADTLERWPCLESERPVGDRFLIRGQEIER
jgi:hypothetical protein